MTMTSPWTRTTLALAALLMTLSLVGAAQAEPIECQKTIAKESAKLLQTRIKALQKCQDARVKRGVSCPDQKATGAISKASAKLTAGINKACGGDDKVCGGDLTGEDLPSSIDWPSRCQDFERAACDNRIADCHDIATCLDCITAAASTQAIDLSYGSLSLPSTSNKPLNGCQRAIGKASAFFLKAKSKALQKCWDARLAGQHTSSCVSPA